LTGKIFGKFFPIRFSERKADVKIFKKWASREYSLAQRVPLMICAGGLFAFLIPYTLIVWAPRLDVTLGIPRLSFGIAQIILFGLVILTGIFFAFWSIGDQIWLAHGTPVPVMATQKLLVSGPFKYCRNPMTLGTALAYGGIALLVGSFSSFLLVAVFIGLLVVYLKRIEEKELALRFGQEYLDYKARTPFIIPKFTRK
jgi:protein-S-isoprenylcysteine O-methyltransferase Ste14